MALAMCSLSAMVSTSRRRHSRTAPSGFRRPSENAAVTKVAHSIVEAQPWWEVLVDEDSRKCQHTHNFVNWFLPHIDCPNKRRVGKCNDGSKWLCGLSHLASQKSCVVYSFGSSKDSCFEWRG